MSNATATAASFSDASFNRSLADADPAVFGSIQSELGRQRHEIELIASENIVSRAVLEAQGSVMTNKYAEGYPGRRYYGGCHFVDIAEELAIERVKQMFDCSFANVQPNSGSQANQAVLLALAKPGDTLLGMIEGKRPDAEYLAALGRLLADDKADPAFRALCVELPPEEEIATAIAALGRQPDPQAIHAARESLAAEIARMHEDALDRIYREMAVPGPYSPEADAAGKRSLRLTALALLSRIDGGARAGELYRATDNMTERAAALAMLIAANGGDAEVASFYSQFKDIRLVMDMWFLLQPLNADPDRAVDVAKTLAAHPDFDWKNPNRFRALIGGLCGNHAGFHRADGAGYDFLADWLIRMDAVNPQIAARMSSALESWTRYDAGRQAHARAALDRILSQPKLSKNLGEMIGRIRSAT